MEMYYEEFGKTLKRIRKERGLCQTALGGLIGVSKAAVSKYENAISYPSYNVLVKIAKTFDVSTDYLLGAKESRTISVEGLSGRQINLLANIAEEYRELNKEVG